MNRLTIPGPPVAHASTPFSFRGRWKFIRYKLYMPSNLDKYGINNFWACECDAKNDYPYLRKEATGVRLGDRNVGLAAVIVTVQTLTKDLKWALFFSS